jgi:hypothetical protein
MPVVINEFEVVDEPPSARPAASEAPGSGDATPLSAFEIQRIQRFLEERALRTWAH